MPNLIQLIFVEYRRRLFWIPILVGLAIALFSPVDVLRYTMARTLVNVMAGIVPMIDHIDAQYELAQVLQLYFSVMWMSAPIIYYSLDVGDKEKQLVNVKTRSVAVGLSFMFFIALFLLFIWLFFFSERDLFAGIGTTYFISHSRVGMATYGGVIVHGIVGVAKVLVRMVDCFRKVYFN